MIRSILSNEQTAFVKNRQILDVSLMVNEVVECYKKNKKKMMVLKIDFAKAYDSVSWNFLDRDMQFMHFGDKLRS